MPDHTRPRHRWHRALRTARAESLICAEHDVFGDFGGTSALDLGGDMNAAIASCDQVAGRIDEVAGVADVFVRSAG